MVVICFVSCGSILFVLPGGDGDDGKTGEEGLYQIDLCGEYTVRHSSI